VPTNTELNNELLLFTSTDAAAAFASALKLPVGGYRYFSDGMLFNVGGSGYYWSSTVSGSSAFYLGFASGAANISITTRAFGFSVRCIKE